MAAVKCKFGKFFIFIDANILLKLFTYYQVITQVFWMKYNLTRYKSIQRSKVQVSQPLPKKIFTNLAYNKINLVQKMLKISLRKQIYISIITQTFRGAKLNAIVSVACGYIPVSHT